MRPEQIPGTLFILLLATLALTLGEHRIILLLAFGCAAGGASFSPGWYVPATILALAAWGFSFLLLFIRII